MTFSASVVKGAVPRLTQTCARGLSQPAQCAPQLGCKLLPKPSTRKPGRQGHHLLAPGPEANAREQLHVWDITEGNACRDRHEVFSL